MRNSSCGVGAVVVINWTPLCSDMDILYSLTLCFSLWVSIRSYRFRTPRLFCPMSVFFIHLYASHFELFFSINISLFTVLSLFQGQSHRQRCVQAHIVSSCGSFIYIGVTSHIKITNSFHNGILNMNIWHKTWHRHLFIFLNFAVHI